MKAAWRLLHSLRVGLLLVMLCFLLGVEDLRSPQAGMAQATLDHKMYLPVIYRILPIAPAPNTPPLASPSYYFFMRNYTQSKARSFGCQLGTRDKNLAGKQESLVILDFGIPKLVNGQYGASGMQVGGFVPLTTIADAAEQFGLGYWDCTDQDFASILHIAIGTNNYNNSAVYSNLSVTYEHGRQWAQMVNQVNDWFLNVCPSGCNGQVDAMGANDIELAWSEPEDAINWVNGYDSANKYPLINFGAAEGCPNFCGGGGHTWTREEVWQVTNAGPVYSLPEIYLNSGANARQWYGLSVYSVQAHGYPYDFAGTLTTYTACVQYPESSCEYIDNTPAEGWTQLYNYVNTTDYSTFDDLQYSSDIGWTE